MLPAIFPRDQGRERVGLFIHVVTVQWLVYALVLLHVAVRRDGVLDRMLPQGDAQTGGPIPMGSRRQATDAAPTFCFLERSLRAIPAACCRRAPLHAHPCSAGTTPPRGG